MKISVIIPTFNRSGFISRAIKSVLDQHSPDVEIVIVDDGSTDNTEAVVKEIFFGSAERMAVVRYYKKENGGCASARNRGIKESQGEAVIFLDSDDALLPGALANMAEILGSCDAGFVYSPSLESWSDGVVSVNLPAAAGHPESFAVEHFMTSKARQGAVMFRRAVLDKVGGFDENLRYNEDSELLQRAAILFKSVYCPKPSVKVYHHKDNKSDNRIAIYRSMISGAERILKDFPEFHLSLGELAQKRLSELRGRLIESLILADDLGEAEKISREYPDSAGFFSGISIKIKSQFPLRWYCSCRNGFLLFKRILGSRIRKVFKRHEKSRAL